MSTRVFDRVCSCKCKEQEVEKCTTLPFEERPDIAERVLVISLGMTPEDAKREVQLETSEHKRKKNKETLYISLAHFKPCSFSQDENGLLQLDWKEAKLAIVTQRPQRRMPIPSRSERGEKYNARRGAYVSPAKPIGELDTTLEEPATKRRKSETSGNAGSEDDDDVEPNFEWRMEGMKKRIKKLESQLDGKTKQIRLLKRVLTSYDHDVEDEVNWLDHEIQLDTQRLLRNTDIAQLQFESYVAREEADDDDDTPQLSETAFYKLFGISLDFFKFLYDEMASHGFLRIVCDPRSEKPQTFERRSTMEAGGIRSYRDELLLLLFHLRSGATRTTIAVLVGLDLSSVSRMIAAWTAILHVFLNTLFPPPTIKEIERRTPEKLRLGGKHIHYFLDATELKIESPGDFATRKRFYSLYKSATTIKMIGVLSASGDVVYISNAYCGASPDDFVVRHSKLVEMLGEGAIYVGDKGFLDFIHYIDNKCQLVTPPRAFNGQKRLTLQQIQAQLNICKKRIHIERVFGAIKNTWRIFKSPIPITQVADIDVAFGICAHLTAVMRKPFCAFGDSLDELNETVSLDGN